VAGPTPRARAICFGDRPAARSSRTLRRKSSSSILPVVTFEACQQRRHYQARHAGGQAWAARRRGRRPLRFSVSGATEIERAYRTHWVSPELSAAKRLRLAQRQSRPPDLVVLSPLKD
jgi:hypothetical protein